MTAQIKDVCRYLGREIDMPDCLPFPKEHSNIVRLNQSEFALEDKEGVYTSTLCWRQHVATWEVSEERLYLTGLSGLYRLIDSKPVFADWYSGEFELPQGELVSCNLERDFELVYEQSITLKIKAGKLISAVLRDVV
jgi:hypothetical protein